MRYVSVLGGKFNICNRDRWIDKQLCNRDRCIDTSVTLGHGGVPVECVRKHPREFGRIEGPGNLCRCG